MDSVSRKYIYELPFDINRELCRLLDNDDDWKELAGIHMKYSAFEINEIEQSARRLAVSPTSQLFTRWGQLNHRVEELFILLYKMKHIPALNCLKPLVGERYHLLLSKNTRNGCRDRPTASIDDESEDVSTNSTRNANYLDKKSENGNHPKVCKLYAPNPKPIPKINNGSQSSLPIPVMLLEQGVQLPTSSRGFNGNLATDDSSTDNNTSSTQDTDRAKGDMNDDFLRQHVSAVPMLKYSDLKEATNNWSESNLLGKGGFGQVYKGEWKLLSVAVKRLRDNNDGKNRELIREMCLNQYRHDNILPLYGYSLGGPEACLVYQLMAGGSLEMRLRCKTHHPPLTWSQRYRIAHGVARGLQYLHTMTDTPMIHGDIKPANILLDQCTIPKIGDFGLARKGPYGEERTHVKVSRVHGTRPYLPDEYLRSRCLSPAVDVFSYGVVLVETATGLPPLDRARAQPLLSEYILQLARDRRDMATLEDRMITGTQISNPYLCREFVSLGIHCTQPARHERPSMLQVYKQLDALDFPGKHASLQP